MAKRVKRYYTMALTTTTQVAMIIRSGSRQLRIYICTRSTFMTVLWSTTTTFTVRPSNSTNIACQSTQTIHTHPVGAVATWHKITTKRAMCRITNSLKILSLNFGGNKKHISIVFFEPISMAPIWRQVTAIFLITDLISDDLWYEYLRIVPKNARETASKALKKNPARYFAPPPPPLGGSTSSIKTNWRLQFGAWISLGLILMSLEGQFSLGISTNAPPLWAW